MAVREKVRGMVIRAMKIDNVITPPLIPPLILRGGETLIRINIAINKKPARALGWGKVEYERRSWWPKIEILAMPGVTTLKVLSPAQYQRPPIEDWDMNWSQARTEVQIIAQGRAFCITYFVSCILYKDKNNKLYSRKRNHLKRETRGEREKKILKTIKMRRMRGIFIFGRIRRIREIIKMSVRYKVGER